MSTYADAGVNIELGDDVSDMLYKASRLTWKNRWRKLGEIRQPSDNFAGNKLIDISNLPSGTQLYVGCDGVGTKTEIAERVGDHSTIAYDLFAMVCDDAVRFGIEPALVATILDVNSLEFGEDAIRQLAQGYVGAANEAEVAIVNGEVAELGMRVGGYGNFNYNWGATCIGFYQKDKLITGEKIQEGDVIISFESMGFRSNGLSLVRKILTDHYGNNWHEEKLKHKTLGEMVLEPSKIYTGVVRHMLVEEDGEPHVDVHGIAHVTGGGIPEKLGRVLKSSGLGAEIEKLWGPTDAMNHCQEIGDVKDREAYKTWNMGTGMLVVVPEEYESKVRAMTDHHGVFAMRAGHITEEPGIRIRNDGFFQEEEVLEF